MNATTITAVEHLSGQVKRLLIDIQRLRRELDATRTRLAEVTKSREEWKAAAKRCGAKRKGA